MEMMQDSEVPEAVRRALIGTAEGMLAGNIDLISGCRELNRLRIHSNLQMSEAFETIEIVESETDQYPIGEVRSQYNRELLSRLDIWAAACLERARPSIRDACAALIRQHETDSRKGILGMEADRFG